MVEFLTRQEPSSREAVLGGRVPPAGAAVRGAGAARGAGGRGGRGSGGR